MSRLGPRARRFISGRIDHHADEIDATVLQNRVVEADDGAPETLYHLATAAAQAWYALDDDSCSEPVSRNASEAFDNAHDALEQYIDELVARECVGVIQHADRWADEWDHCDPEDCEAAIREAREWLQQHTEIARRAGVLDELEVRA